MKKRIRNELMLVFLPALVLWFSVFGLTAMAQTDSDKPLDSKALTALVEALKKEVSRISPDANETAMVAEKWDKRKDLAGKTKKDVINLLYADVKSVIKDSGVLYQIYSMFSFYKTISDEPQSVTAEEKPESLLVDSFVYSNSEDASSRIDLWRNAMNESPQNRGFVIVYGGQVSKRGEIEAHIRGIKQAFGLKGIDEKRTDIVNGGFRETLSVEFWVVPQNSSPPLPSPTVDVKKVRFKGKARKIIPYECCFD